MLESAGGNSSVDTVKSAKNDSVDADGSKEVGGADTKDDGLDDAPLFDEDCVIEGFDDELLAIDIESLVAARETQRIEQVNAQLISIVDTLMNSHVAKSLPLTIAQTETCFSTSF